MALTRDDLAFVLTTKNQADRDLAGSLPAISIYAIT
jgi:hypothetical protein